jgi:DNA-binding CsgD family transcriptional regulator/DNA-binding beta-propeller fold protein YncE
MARVEVGRAALSQREKEVAALVAEGLTNRAIAQRLFISERTVDGHLEHVREKLGFSNRAQIATWYVTQPTPGTGVVVAPSPSRHRPQKSALMLAIAAALVLALVAVIAVQRLRAPAVPDGPALTTFAGTAQAAQFNRPQSVALGGDGSIYVADSDHFAIKRIDVTRGTISIFAGGHDDQFVDGSDALSASIGNPTSVAVAPDGKTVFFANGSIVARVDPDSTVHFVAGDPMREPVGLAFAPDGSLYIADLGGNSVWLRTPGGALRRFAGSGEYGFGGDRGPALGADLGRPRAVAVDADGNLLIADTGNNRIRKVDHVSNVIATIAGSSDVYGFAGDRGRADQARLSLPWGVASGPDRSVYVADTGNNRIRRVTPAGTITTVLGGQGILNGPGGIAISGSGDLYIADIGDSRLYVVHHLAAR